MALEFPALASIRGSGKLPAPNAEATGPDDRRTPVRGRPQRHARDAARGVCAPERAPAPSLQPAHASLRLQHLSRARRAHGPHLLGPPVPRGRVSQPPHAAAEGRSRAHDAHVLLREPPPRARRLRRAVGLHLTPVSRHLLRREHPLSRRRKGDGPPRGPARALARVQLPHGRPRGRHAARRVHGPAHPRAPGGA